MGIIKAAADLVKGNLGDQWLEVYEAENMGDQTVFTRGVQIRRGQNTKGTDNTVSNGSVVHVYDNQFMILVDGGRIVDYTAEPGYYTINNSSLPSMLNGQFGDSLSEAFKRFISSIYRRSRESSSAQDSRSTILIRSIMRNCSFVHTEPIRSRSRIHCSSMRKQSRRIRIMWKSMRSMSSICPNS